MRSKVEFLAVKLNRRWIHKWHKVFCDHQYGGFHERLGEHFKPIEQPHKRLVSQCRQLAIYAHASAHHPKAHFEQDLKIRFDFLKSKFFIPETGGWRFSVDPTGDPLDDTYDLYGNAFVIFALCFYFQATGDPVAMDLSRQTADFIDQKFRHENGGGFVEALDPDLKSIPKMRRQNPHMHLFEACLFAAKVFEDDIYYELADEMYVLFDAYFFDEATATLGEFFDEDLTPHREDGHKVEPGHHFEWVWLLKKYADLKGDTARLKTQRMALLDFANIYGYDSEYGGIYDVLDRRGEIIADTKRVWPFTEGLKANAMMLDEGGIDKLAIKQRVKDMIDIFEKKYIEPRGFWTESLNKDLSSKTDYMPATTPYHVYFGIMETLAYLRSRGESKSWSLKLKRTYYKLRRGISFKG